MYTLLNLQFLEFTLLLTGEFTWPVTLTMLNEHCISLFFFHSSFSCNPADFDEFLLAVYWQYSQSYRSNKLRVSVLGDTLKIFLNSNVELDIRLSISSFLLHLGPYAVLSCFMVQTLSTVNNSPETQRDTNTAHMPTIERSYHGTWRQAIAHRARVSWRHA